MCKIDFMLNFKKIFVSIVLCLTLFNTNSYSEIVEKIEIKGNERISEETIMIFGDIAVGKNYETSDVNMLIKKLYETTFFSNISVQLINNKLRLFPNPSDWAFKDSDRIWVKFYIKNDAWTEDDNYEGGIRGVNSVNTVYRDHDFHWKPILWSLTTPSLPLEVNL